VIAFGFVESLETAWICAQYIEGIFFLEIFLHFFTSYRDFESNELIISLKSIARNYAINGPFLYDFVAIIPFQLIFMTEQDDPENQTLRNILMLKLVRLTRIGANFIPSKNLAKVWASINKPHT
jgi:hypothetical protein